jgi:hypothetical protein
MNTLTMPEATATAIMEWAKAKLERNSELRYSDDWWESFDNDWDINIWRNDMNDEIRVTAYKMTVTDGEWNTDHSNWVSVGVLREPASWYDGHSCDQCGDPMGGKYDGDQPTYYGEDGIAHLRCTPL